MQLNSKPTLQTKYKGNEGSTTPHNIYKTMMTNTTIIDIEETCHGQNIIVTCCMEAPGVKKNIKVCLDAVKMGIDTKGEFEMELSKDFLREVENFHTRNKRLPTFYDLKRMVECHFYGMGKYESKFSDGLLNMVYGEYGISKMMERLRFLLDNSTIKRDYIKSIFTPRNLREFDRLAKVCKQNDAPDKLRSFINTI